MNFLAIDHMVLRVRDLDRSIGLWRDIMGCPVAKVQEERFGAGGYGLSVHLSDPDGNGIELRGV